MGQQQLLLVILVTILVGVATVVAINVFGSSAENANRDAVRQDMLSIATAAQGWYIKPTMLAGGGNDFTNITFSNISFASNAVNQTGDYAINNNGTYQITQPTKDNFLVRAYPSSESDYNSTLPVIGVDGSITTEATFNTTTRYLEVKVLKNSVLWTKSSINTTTTPAP